MAMKRIVRAVLAGLAVLAAMLATPAAAARLVTADISQVLQILQRDKHKVELKTYEGEAYLSVNDADSYSYKIFFYGCNDKGSQCTSIQFYASFDPAKPPTLDAMNTYNREHRFGRAYLDKDSYPAIEWDINMASGISEDVFLDDIALWSAMMNIYGDFLFGKNGENEKPKS